MLSLERFREVLGEDAPEDDDELHKLRDAIYALGHLAVDAFLAETGDPPVGKERDQCE